MHSYCCKKVHELFHLRVESSFILLSSQISCTDYLLKSAYQIKVSQTCFGLNFLKVLLHFLVLYIHKCVIFEFLNSEDVDVSNGKLRSEILQAMFLNY